MRNYHLAILKKPYLDAILTGSKQIESRLYKTKHPPIGQIQPGDKIFFKISSGPVCATAIVEKVLQFENLTAEQIISLKQKYNHLILGDDEYWLSKSDCRFGFLIWLTDVQPIEPVSINKKDWRAWVVLKKEQNFNLLQKTLLKTAK